MYEKFFKRGMDFLLSLIALIVLAPVFVILIIVGAIAMQGNPFFTQLRPGKIDPKTGKEKIFKLIKFRTMSNRKDREGNLLPDAERLNKYGRILRSTSLDELPELPTADRDVLMSDVDNGQLSLFDGDVEPEEDAEKEEKTSEN